jgi:hypothetical protein
VATRQAERKRSPDPGVVEAEEPSALVEAPFVVPFINTVTGNPSLVFWSVALPDTVRVVKHEGMDHEQHAPGRIFMNWGLKV